jgi:hypothetical protein
MKSQIALLFKIFDLLLLYISDYVLDHTHMNYVAVIL